MPREVLNRLVYNAILEKEDLADKGKLNSFAENLVHALSSNQTNGCSYNFNIAEDSERSAYCIELTIRTHGIDTLYHIDYDFVTSTEYERIKSLNNAINGMMEEGAYIKRGEKQKNIESFAQALDWLMSEARRGQYIQRYKGLGEMNPEQLWETTMDPESRRMLQVTIEDAIAADQLFTTLMGDHVEPRRAFIEENALKVENLDV